MIAGAVSIFILWRFVELTDVVFSQSNIMDIFNSIACNAALLIQQPKSPLSTHALHNIEQGMALMTLAYTSSPRGRDQQFLKKCKKLEMEAKASLKSANALPIVSGMSTLLDTGQPAFSGMNGIGGGMYYDALDGTGGTGDMDFNAWIAQMVNDEDFGQ